MAKSFKRVAKPTEHKTEPKQETKPKLVMPRDVAGFKAGDTLTLAKHIGLAVRTVIADNRSTDDRKLDEAAIDVDDKRIMSVLGEMATEGLEPEDIFLNLVTAVTELIEAREPTADIDEMAKVSDLVALAKQAGEKASDKLQSLGDNLVEAKKAWDGGPIALEPVLVETYGENFLLSCPLVGTRKQGGKNRRNESTDNVPDGYNLPTDYFLVPGAEKPKQRFCDLWVKEMSHVKPFIAQSKVIGAILNDAVPALIPQHINALRDADGNWHKAKLTAMRDDLNGEITKRVDRYSKALHFWQQKRAISEKLPKVKVTTVDRPEKSNKPIIIYGESKLPDGTTTHIPDVKPRALSSFLRMNVEQAKQKGGRMADLLATIAREPKAPSSSTGAKAEGGDVVQEIDKVEVFTSVLHRVWSYADNHASRINETLKGPNGPELAYWLCTFFDQIQPFVSNKNVQTMAKNYDTEQTAGRAATAKLEMDTKNQEHRNNNKAAA